MRYMSQMLSVCGVNRRNHQRTRASQVAITRSEARRLVSVFTVRIATDCGSTLQPATINKQLKQIGRVFRVAHKWKLLRELPEITLLKERKSDFDFLDFDEAEAFLASWSSPVRC